MSMRVTAAALALWMMAAAGAFAQQGGRPDPAYDAARTAFERLAEADRRAVQEALVWTGDYNGTIGTTFGRRTFEALQAVQRRAKAPADGILDERARASLLAAAAREKTAAGFRVTDDARAGVRIGIPGAVLRETGAVPGQVPGTRWQSADERITLDTRRYEPDGPTLEDLFERIAGSQARGRTITYKLLRPDFFVVQGETQTGKFFVRNEAGPAGVRGFSIGYDKALARSVDRLVIAIANSFEGFPGAKPSEPARPSTPPPAGVSEAADPASGTVLVVAPGRGVTSGAALSACAEPRAGGHTLRLLRTDAATGLALVELAPATGTPAALPAATPPEGADVLVLAAGGGGRPLLVTPGIMAGGGRVSAALQPGAAGAVVLDRAGGLVGIVAAVPDKPLMVAGVVPPRSHAVVPASGLTALDWVPAPGTSETGRSAGLLAAAAAPAVLPLRCRR